ncbi:hypothetical protein [Trinickia sp. Y13]|uniref:hypothetical protein n=1 Tax=Trinickia sp. Y13 TaxID=2917807 RepID=UPI00240526E1|nr:hypothetical protein [Trinickia sp. Y13]MDG0024944.1 hypothetical protein [Trinickia sp. Y13]
MAVVFRGSGQELGVIAISAIQEPFMRRQELAETAAADCGDSKATTVELVVVFEIIVGAFV